jgi:Tol biopolymer transport system component
VQLGPSPVPGHAEPYPGEGALVLIDRDGGGRLDVRLPAEWEGRTRGGWPDEAVWAPTGERLAVWVGPPSPCASCRADGAPVVVVGARDGRTTPAGTALYGALSWAPDGTFLVLSAPAGRETYVGKHLVRVDLPTGVTLDLARDPAWADTAPAVSPDGRQVAFARGVALVDGRPAGPLPPGLHVNVAAPASRRVWLAAADGSSPRRLTDAAGWADEAPAWTPDGRWVVFVRWRPAADEPGAAELWAVRPDGTDARRLAALGEPPGFYGGVGYYGDFAWNELFAVAPR